MLCWCVGVLVWPNQNFPYLSAFEGGGESGGQYYTATPTPGLQLFTVNSNMGKPQAAEADQQFAAQQMQWLRAALAESPARFKLLFFHHPVHSTAQHDAPARWMDQPYDRWGASAVLMGHQHCYERLALRTKAGAALGAEPAPDTPDQGSAGIPWVTNGIGGHPWLYDLHHCKPYPGSRVRYNSYHGAMIGILSAPAPSAAAAAGAAGHRRRSKQPAAQDQLQLDMCFYSLENGATLVDHFTL